MHFAIVEDLKIDQNHLIHLIQENLEKHGETAHFDCYESGEAFLEAFRPGLLMRFYGYYAGPERAQWH